MQGIPSPDAVAYKSECHVDHIPRKSVTLSFCSGRLAYIFSLGHPGPLSCRHGDVLTSPAVMTPVYRSGTWQPLPKPLTIMRRRLRRT